MVYGSYNDSAQFTSEDEQAKGFVLMSSYFENKANITAIEFVPMTAGQLIIEVYRKTIIIVNIQLGLFSQNSFIKRGIILVMIMYSRS